MSTIKSIPSDSKQGIVRSTSLISLGTLVSRILGFVRDIILARLLGTAMRADAFFVAFRIPSLLRDIVGEGAVNSTVVPVLSEYAATKKQELWNLVSVVMAASLIILSFLTLTGIAMAPVLVRVIAPGFVVDPEKLALTVRLTRMMFPYLVFIGLTAQSMGVLYTFRSFAAPAFSPCLLNIAIIVSALIASRAMSEPVYGLAIGVLIGGVAQLAIQLPPMVKNGMRLRRPATLLHPGARKIGYLLLPRLFGSGVYLLNVFIDTVCASLSFVVGVGGVAAIYYANRILQFPMGIFSIALASAVLPALSNFTAHNNTGDFRSTLIFSLKNIFFIMVPISVVLGFLGRPIVQLLFQRGEFDAYSAAITSHALVFYAIGLVGFSSMKIMVTAFHARQDTKTPACIAGLCLCINALLNIILMWPLKIGGIALASSIAGTVNFLILFRIMSRQLGGIGTYLGEYLLKLGLAAVMMAGALAWCRSAFAGLSPAPHILIHGAIGSIVFMLGCFVFRVDHARNMMRWILKRK